MNRMLLWTLTLIVISCVKTPASLAAEFFLASWNLENLFDTEDDPSVEGDEDFTADAPKKWTPERLDIKLANLASIIRKMNGGRGPDVLGVCEVENRKVVEMLVAQVEIENAPLVFEDAGEQLAIDASEEKDAHADRDDHAESAEVGL